MPRVKGLAFRSVLKGLAALKGVVARERVLGALEERRSSALRFVVASSRYPIEDYFALGSALQRDTGSDPDLPRVIGRRCGEQDLRFVHGVAFSALAAETALEISVRLFGNYQDTGNRSARHTGDGVTRVECTGCVGFSEPLWTELRGSPECFAAQASKSPATSLVVSGGRDGEPNAVIDVSRRH
jgi:hypothetical protein